MGRFLANWIRKQSLQVMHSRPNYSLRELCLVIAIAGTTIAGGWQSFAVVVWLTAVIAGCAALHRAYFYWERRSPLPPEEMRHQLRSRLLRSAGGLAVGFVIGIFVADSVVQLWVNRLTEQLKEFRAPFRSGLLDSILLSFDHWP